MKKQLYFFCLYLILASWASDINAQSTNRHDFPDLLDIKGIPNNENAKTPFVFSDQGAWMGYALLPDSIKEMGFVGPLLIDENEWLSQQFTKTEVLIFHKNKWVAQKWKKNESTYFPGKLCQTLSNKLFKCVVELIFIDAHTAAYRITISNQTKQSIAYRLRSKASSWHKNYIPTQRKKHLMEWQDTTDLKDAYRSHFYWISGKEDSIFKEDLSNGKSVFSKQTMTYQLSAKQEKQHYFLNAFYFGDQVSNLALEKNTKRFFSAPNNTFKHNEIRWQGYLQKVLNPLSKAESRERTLAVKACMTLLTNWRAAANELPFDGLFPSYQPGYFHGFWSWDNWKHAAALARFHPQLAKDQLRSLLYYQNEQGMIPDCIFRDSDIEAHNYRDTKPPLLAWGAAQVIAGDAKQTIDSAIFDQMLRYHKWWYQYRDHNKNEICEYGSTDGTKTAAKWESGMDNAIRFDHIAILQTDSAAYSMDQESVDLNAYLYADQKYLADIAERLNQIEMADSLRADLDFMKLRFQRYFFDHGAGYFFDKKINNDDFVKVKGPEAWIMLWAEIATEQQAKAVVEEIMNLNSMNSFIPFPSISLLENGFNPEKGYWRGPVWLDQAYFALNGMRKYGFQNDANTLLNKLLQNANGLFLKGAPIYENYHPLSGKGLNAPYFSWSAAHILLMLWEKYEAE